MKELKILAVVVIFTLVTYWGVEPYAHSIMHPHVTPADFEYKGMHEFPIEKGNSDRGKEAVMQNCTACHSIKKDGMPPLMSNADLAASYGVVPPDLGDAGYVFDAKFLANFIKNPVKTFHLQHKYDAGDGKGKPFPMPNYEWMPDQDIADIVAYLKSIAPDKLEDKQVFETACGRCHDMKYDKWTALTPPENIQPYMGALPPDLSMMIRSRGEHYLHNFLNDPQKQLRGTSMPRVGLTEHTQEQVIAYMESVGDSKKEERQSTALWVLGYLAIFAVLAYLWKQSLWKDLH